MDLTQATPDLEAAILGSLGEAVQEAAWKAIIDQMVQRAFGMWRVIGAGAIGSISMPGNHSLEVVS